MTAPAVESDDIIKLTADIIYGFTIHYLQSRYDSPKPIPAFHPKMWGLCCLPDPYVVMAAPRSHGKSTAVTNAFLTTGLALRAFDFVLLLSSTETFASEFLGTIRNNFFDNEEINNDFSVKRLEKDTGSDIIIVFKDGHKCRVLAKGAGPDHKIRGIKWGEKRPNMVLFDDIESDSAVLNAEIRRKFSNWFDEALSEIGSDYCLYRGVGTILHLASLLSGLLESETWVSDVFRAHGKDFSDILWPEKFPRARLERIRTRFIEKGNLEGYSKEYLNNPLPEGETYFRLQDLQKVDELPTRLVYFSAADFAISETERSDYTVIMTAGMDEKGNLYIVDVRRDRMDSDEIIKELLSVQKRYNPEIFTFETEKIDKAIGPFLNREMRKQGIYLNINKITPTKSKTTRGRSIQAMTKSGSVYIHESMDLIDDFIEELMSIGPSGPKGKHDDFFDAFSYIGLTVDQYYEANDDDEQYEEEYEEEHGIQYEGICERTGY